mmetsp:Transcript_96291/g.274318  ORF Transcript_96291/g.274318 Transcript_96291/m.274318 type:complete len:88 (+) Transcript_96291:344-607(+)
MLRHDALPYHGHEVDPPPPPWRAALTARSLVITTDIPLQNEVESLRLKTNEYEMIVAQHGNNTLVVIQDTADKEHHVGEEEEEEKKE